MSEERSFTRKQAFGKKQTFPRIALVGYGRMGREVDALAARRGIVVTGRATSTEVGRATGLAKALAGADVAIDFSLAQAVAGNVLTYCELGLDAVVGVTGWEGDRQRVLSMARESGIGLVHGSNFSIGANAFFSVAGSASKTLAPFSGLYDFAISETHHRAKLDAPSGTALRVKSVVEGGGWPRPVEVTSVRVGRVPGTHELVWDSDFDTITLRHAARSRAGFADGALLAARWIRGRVGVYDFSAYWQTIAAAEAAAASAPGPGKAAAPAEEPEIGD